MQPNLWYHLRRHRDARGELERIACLEKISATDVRDSAAVILKILNLSSLRNEPDGEILLGVETDLAARVTRDADGDFNEIEFVEIIDPSEITLGLPFLPADAAADDEDTEASQ